MMLWLARLPELLLKLLRVMTLATKGSPILTASHYSTKRSMLGPAPHATRLFGLQLMQLRLLELQARHLPQVNRARRCSDALSLVDTGPRRPGAVRLAWARLFQIAG